MEYISPFTERVNAIIGIAVALLSYIFGKNWILFVGFFALNIGDVITGYMKARYNHNSNSHKGAEGILKKLAYWIMIMLAFGMAACFQEIGKIIGSDLGVTSLIGWFVLATLAINEVRSILENLVEMDITIPAVLIKGLEVANKAIDGTAKITEDRLDVDVPIDKLTGKKKIVLEIDRSEERKEE